MKRFMIVLGALLALILRGVAQEVPKGVYVPQVMSGGTNEGVAQICVKWTSCSFLATFDVAGEVTSMDLYGGSGLIKSFPASRKDLVFENSETWRKLATKVRGELVITGDNSYTELEPFELIGMSTVISSNELPPQLQALIFRKADRFLAVTLDRWVGPTPEIGATLNVGQTRSGNHFFWAVGTDNKVMPFREADAMYELSNVESSGVVYSKVTGVDKPQQQQPSLVERIVGKRSDSQPEKVE